MSTLEQKIQELKNRFDHNEPGVQAYVAENGRFERLQKEAISLENTFPKEAQRPPLYGCLVGVKDIFHVDGFPTQAGSRLPPEVIGGKESEAVSTLKAQGALIVGKTVTTEFAYFGPGPTRNPHNHAHTPGGSSSGSAAAVAAGLCDIAFGTQTIGSVNRPAAFCGVAGYKPSFDRISKRGVIPLSGSLDHVGLFAKTVGEIETAAAALNRGWQPHRVTRKPRLGIPTGPYLSHADEEARQHLEAVSEKLQSAGFEIIKVAAMDDFQSVYDRHQLILAAEAAAIHESWYAQFKDLYHFKTAELIEKGKTIPVKSLSGALSEIPPFRNQLRELMQVNAIDLWLTPSAPGPAPHGLDITGNPVMNLPWTQSGLPTLTIPSGRADNGLPLGTQLVGGWFQDEKLFAFGRLIEDAIGVELSIA